jgi:sec-independent protein translocase protein TatB
MFEVGFTEIILIFGIALLVLGPARLPKLAADLGRWAGRARAMARQLRTQLEQEVQFDPLASNGGATSGPSTSTSSAHTQPPPAEAQAAEPAPATSEPVAEAPSSPHAEAATPTPAESSPGSETTVPDERKPG